MTEPRRGLFITMEGTEGVGKSTNMEFLANQLAARGIDYVVTREPGGTPMAEEIRELLLRRREEPVQGLTELLLMFAARSQHLHSFILPRLKEGVWVLCDRFTDATYAYQGGGRQMPMEQVQLLEQLVQGDRRPDHVLLLDAPVAVGMQRIRGRDLAPDRFEQEQQAFFQRVQDVYRERARQAPERYHQIDASQPLNQVQSDLSAVLDTIIMGRHH
ncbi:MAG: dTMP kinase [Halomonadaceae bacterium]|nr:MAG: dTMP kinase [Halomonadaceae bacterium]